MYSLFFINLSNMSKLFRQISFTISIIALIATIVGFYGFINAWEWHKSLNLTLTGITGLIVSSSFALTVQSKRIFLRITQVFLSAYLIWITTLLDINMIFHYSLGFQLLWLTTITMIISMNDRIQIISYSGTLLMILLSHIFHNEQVLYIISFTLLVMSSLMIIKKGSDQSQYVP